MMIEYKKTSDAYYCTPVLEFESTEDRDLAARILEAFQWAEANGVTVWPLERQGLWRAEIDLNTLADAPSRLEAIENLRAKVEPSNDRVAEKADAPEEVGEPEQRPPPDSHAGSSPAPVTISADKRVPAELWEKVKDRLYAIGVQSPVIDDLEACPDIVDEPATLDPTAQAVLDAHQVFEWPLNWQHVSKAVGAWIAAGRPTVVRAEQPAKPSECDLCGKPSVGYLIDNGAGARLDYCQRHLNRDRDDAATLAALNECRDLGLSFECDQGRWTVWLPDDDGAGSGSTLPEALAAYKAAQAPQVEYSDMQLLDYIDNEDVTFELKHHDDWHWWECEGHKGKTPREAISAAMRANGIGPECPPPPKGDD